MLILPILIAKNIFNDSYENLLLRQDKNIKKSYVTHEASRKI